MIKVPYVRLFTSYTEESLRQTLDIFEQTIRKSDFILGAAVAEFEKAFADYLGAKHAVSVNSGLDALVLSLKALEIGPGDEVITVPNSFIASAAAIALVGARPVFVDVASDYNIDCEKIEAAVSSRTKAILPVHLTGSACRMDHLVVLSEKLRLPIVEDAAQAIGAEFNGKKIGTFGVTGCFSLHPLKNLHVWGDGGVVTTNSDAIAERLKLGRNHGLKNRDECEFFSYNSRLDSLQAVVAMRSLRDLDSVTTKRRSNALFYRSRLVGLPGITLPVETPESHHVYHVFQIRVASRDKLRNFLTERGVETKIHYPIPLHLQEASKELGYSVGSFPVTERLASEIVSLPIHESLSDEELTWVVDCVREFSKSSNPLN